VNGRKVEASVEPGAYAALRRPWKTGDKIQLEIAMPVRLLESHPLVEETRNHLAVARGPVVYCLEAADLPEGTNVSDICLPRSVELAPEWQADLLGGIAILKGQAVRRRFRDWRDKLYDEAANTGEEPLDIVLTPHYSWRNRGEGDMSVWLPAY